MSPRLQTAVVACFAIHGIAVAAAAQEIPSVGLETTPVERAEVLPYADLIPTSVEPEIVRLPGVALKYNVRPAAHLQPLAADDGGFRFGVGRRADARRFVYDSLSDSQSFDVGIDPYAIREFLDGLIVVGPSVAMKFGGYVKADFIYDFDPIDSTDLFDTTSIPVGAPPRTNARYHARQTRFYFDTRWLTHRRVVRILVEGDFFSEGNRYRLRHAYGEVGSLLVGQTWTTFTDMAAIPATLDFEGSVSGVNRRQAQARWTQPIFSDDLTLAVAVEDTRFIVEAPPELELVTRSPSPDFVGHLRWRQDWCELQAAGLFRRGAVQLPDERPEESSAWGFNFTGVLLLTPCTKAYYQILFGEGIGSYRELPDAVPAGDDELAMLPMFGWMVGLTHDWDERWSSNFTYAENALDNTAYQEPGDVHRTTYLAANLLYSPLERVQVGVEYLHGLRENIDGGIGTADRVQVAFIFDLP